MSLPNPPSMRSASAPPLIVSIAPPPVSTSSPAPPNTVAGTVVPTSVTVSARSRLSTISALIVPVQVTSFVLTTVHPLAGPGVTGALASWTVKVPPLCVMVRAFASPSVAVKFRVVPVSVVSAACAAGAATRRTATPARSARRCMRTVIGAATAPPLRTAVVARRRTLKRRGYWRLWSSPSDGSAFRPRQAAIATAA